MSMPFQNVTFDSLFSRSRSSSRASTQSKTSDAGSHNYLITKPAAQYEPYLSVDNAHTSVNIGSSRA
uniref:Uncharacterized protein n=1 Tax=Panagrellus redivivus TaxID=6233 RepID=A0A7E4ZR42_PANRE